MPEQGETDLLEVSLRWRGSTYLLAGGLVMGLLLCVGVGVLGMSRLLEQNMNTPDVLTVTTVVQSSPTVNFVTNTPLVIFPTVTSTLFLPPPTETPTVTPTPGPCEQQVQAGDTLIAIVARCGHRDYSSLLQAVLDLNNLGDANQLQIGQTVLVPWPTPTIDPNQPPTSTPESQSGGSMDSGGIAVAVVDPISGLRIPPTPTLIPGITLHQVRPDENILVIAVQYRTTLRVLSELNPEIQFAQCDFGLDSGGPGCTVQIGIGQQIRVPAPTPTPTLSPTPSGSETPTPTATPTFNMPMLIGPSDRAFFRSDELVTLRWLGTGILSADQTYRIQVDDITTGQSFTSDTTELSYVLPAAWQGNDASRHDYRWSVSLIDRDRPEEPYFVTESRQFTWQGRGENTE